MIDTKELRIGNYVWNNYSGEMIVVDIRRQGVDLCKTLKLPSGSYRDEDIKPIKLTEEWLIDFGFNDEEDDRYFEIILFKDNVKWSNEERQVYLAIHKKELAYILGYGINWTDEFKNLKYVHQLQNLYFVLTGKELNKKS